MGGVQAIEPLNDKGDETMKKINILAGLMDWRERLFSKGGRDALLGASKHGRGKTRPAGYRRSLRNEHKRQRNARKAHR